MARKTRSLWRPTVLAAKPILYRDEWLQSALNRWAWYIYGVSRGTLLDEIGLAGLSEHEIGQLGNHAEDDVLLNISHAMGIAASELKLMTMETINGPTVELSRNETLASRYLWARRSGTRYCPDCLRERPGVFLKFWRLTWAFACVEHRRILLDACPTCLLPLKEITGRSRSSGIPTGVQPTSTEGCPSHPAGPI